MRMVSASITSCQQWSSKSRAMISAPSPPPCASIVRRRPVLLQPQVIAEIIIRGVLAFVDLNAMRMVVAGIQHLREEGALQRPARLRLLAPVAAGHGVVEPAVRRAGIDLDVI